MSLYKKIALATVALTVSFTVAAHSSDSAKAASTKSAVQELTMALIDANAQYAAADPGDKGLHLGELIKAAREKDTRRSLLLLGAILETPGLADRLLEALRPELVASNGNRHHAANEERRRIR